MFLTFILRLKGSKVEARGGGWEVLVTISFSWDRPIRRVE